MPGNLFLITGLHTGEVAAYWHEFARAQPPPPTPAEQAPAEPRVHAE
jgi:hypothetical protein